MDYEQIAKDYEECMATDGHTILTTSWNEILRFCGYLSEKYPAQDKPEKIEGLKGWDANVMYNFPGVYVVELRDKVAELIAAYNKEH